MNFKLQQVNVKLSRSALNVLNSIMTTQNKKAMKMDKGIEIIATN